MNLGFAEMIFLFLLALLVFGPRKLPEIGRQIGRGLSEFRRASNEFRAQIETEVSTLELENLDPGQNTIINPETRKPEGTISSGSTAHRPVTPPATPRGDTPHA